MKSSSPNRRRALLVLGAITAASAALMAATPDRGASGQFGLGVLAGLSVVLLVAAFVKFRSLR